MRVVVVKDGEPLPQLCAPFTYRIGNLCSALVRRGHRVKWMTSTFVHYQKTFYTETETVETLDDGYEMHFLPCGSYQRNISLGRWIHHARYGLGVYKTLRAEAPPDMVVCCVPTLETAAACYLYCKKRGIPLILDIRDPWPRVFVDYVSDPLKPLVRAVFAPYFWAAKYLFSHTDVLTAVSHGFLHWAQQMSGRSHEKRLRDQVIYIGGHQSTDDLISDPVVETTGLRSVYMGAFAGFYEFGPLIEMLEIQAARGIAHHMFIIGQGGERFERLRERLEPLPNVTFTGWVPRERAYAIAKTCHLGWLPVGAGHEGFAPNKLFEYPALGLAVAVPRGCESSDIVEQHGFGLSYERSAESLVSALEELEPGGAKLEGWRANGDTFINQVGNARECSEKFVDLIEELSRESSP